MMMLEIFENLERRGWRVKKIDLPGFYYAICLGNGGKALI